MGTDIYGYLEVRDPLYDQDWFDWDPWSTAMPLHPLLAEDDYSVFGCLFGVRNYAGWEPVAANRGLPVDVTATVKQEFERGIADLHSPTWISWTELSGLDMDVKPPGVRGVLSVHRKAMQTLWYCRDTWPAEVMEQFEQLPWGSTPGEDYGTWQVGDTVLTYTPGTRAEILGPESGWKHVFAVMQALAGRFGGDGVRLIVYFD